MKPNNNVVKKIIKIIAPFEFLRIFLNNLFKYLFTMPDDKMDISVRKKLQNKEQSKIKQEQEQSKEEEH